MTMTNSVEYDTNQMYVKSAEIVENMKSGRCKMMGGVSVQTRQQSEKPKIRGVFCFYDFKISKTYVMKQKKKKICISYINLSDTCQ